jgi:hypothetical protein
MKGMVLETYMAIIFYMSIAFSFFIKGYFINTGVVLGIGTIVVIILYSIQHKCEHPLIKKIKEIF